MDRRDFLKRLLAEGAAIVVGPSLPSRDRGPLAVFADMPRCRLDIYGEGGMLLCAVALSVAEATSRRVRLVQTKPAMALACGTPTRFMLTADSEAICDGTCGVMRGGIQFNSVIAPGGTVTISEFALASHGTVKLSPLRYQ